MEHFRKNFYWNRGLFFFTFVLLLFGLMSDSFSQVALAQTQVPLEGQSAIIEKSLRQSIPPKPVPQNPSKSMASFLNKGRMHASDFAALISPSVDDKGMVYAPKGPGLSYEIDWELVKRDTVQTASQWWHTTITHHDLNQL